MLPINQTLLGDIYPLEERARITGLFSTIWGVSGLLGPAIGGFLTEHVSWRWCFYVNLPLCVLTILLIARFLHERVVRQGHSIDYFGALTLSGSVASLLVALQTTDNPGLAAGLYALAAVLVPVFIWRERRAPEPLMPLWLFRKRAIGVSTLGGLLLGWALYGQSTFMPPYVQGVMGATPTVSGFILAGSSVSWPIASTIGGRLLLRLGFRFPCVLGGAILTAGFGLLLFVGPDSSLLAPLAVTAVLGLGFGFYAVSIILAAQSAVGWEHRGVVTSANQFARNIGGTIGVSIAGAIFTAGVLTSSTPVNPNDLLDPTIRAGLAPDVLAALQALLASSLRSVYELFVGVALVATLVALFLPSGAPTQSSDAGLAPSA